MITIAFERLIICVLGPGIRLFGIFINFVVFFFFSLSPDRIVFCAHVCGYRRCANELQSTAECAHVTHHQQLRRKHIRSDEINRVLQPLFGIQFEIHRK